LSLYRFGKNMSPTKILVVDDDPKVRAVLRRCLETEGYVVTEAGSKKETFDYVARTAFALITLDIHLGDGDGFEIARKMRQTSDVPIIMVTGKCDVIDKVVGLELGADDYITKPFHVREVLARVRSTLRRTKTREGSILLCGCVPACTCGVAEERITFDGLTAQINSLELIDRTGERCSLTSSDFKLLKVFLDHHQRAMSRETLMNLIGGVEWAPLDRTIDNQVARLRKKIERDPTRPEIIKTVRGIGYQFTADIGRGHS
jgi:DNA-binding response OmpR family regulator